MKVPEDIYFKLLVCNTYLPANQEILEVFFIWSVSQANKCPVH